MLDEEQPVFDNVSANGSVLSSEIHSDDSESTKQKKRDVELLTEKLREEKVAQDQATEADLLEEEERKKNKPPKKRPFDDSDSEKEKELRKRFESLKKRK